MATIDECRTALEGLAAKLARNAEEARTRLSLDRTLACLLTDLDVYFSGRLADGQVVNLSQSDDPSAKIRITTTSDDLVAIVDGSLSAASAWASGRLKLEASVLDLLKLRTLL
jgi:hypothetical protein